MSIPRLHTIDDLLKMPHPKWLIEDLFEANSLVMVAGAPGSFKSFLVLDWIMCMALGKPWHGKNVQPCKVLYILGEGKSSLLKRMLAWFTHHGCTNDKDFPRLNSNLRITFDVPQLRMKEHYGGLMTAITADAGFDPSVIVIDTFARSFVGGDENSSLDTGLWIKAAESLRAVGYTVIFLHHTRKNTEFGHQFRGSSAISGAMDTIITVVRNYEENFLKVAVTKQKDHDEGEPMLFRRQVVPTSEEGRDSMVLTLLPPTTRTAEERVLRDVMDNPSLTTAKAKIDEIAARLNIKPIAAKQRLWRFKERLKEIELTPEDLAAMVESE